jgi:protoporphyrinogen oxidase
VASGPDAKTPRLHSAAEIGANPAYALRSATKMCRTSPLRGVRQRPPYFHDGRAADLLAVVNHYDKLLPLGLTAAQKTDLVEYLKSLWRTRHLPETRQVRPPRGPIPAILRVALRLLIRRHSNETRFAMSQSHLSRRGFLRGVGGFTLAPMWTRVDLLGWLQAERQFTGDSVEEAHRLLEDPGATLAGAPRQVHDERYDAVVIGAGIAGLTAGYLLREKRTVILDREAEPGGVSRMEAWNGLEYAIGAAYIIDPDPESEDPREKRNFELLGELDLRTAGEDLATERNKSRRLGGDANHCIFSKRRVVPDAAVYTPQNVRFFRAVLDSDNYPAVPPEDDALVAALDRVSFTQFLRTPALQRKFYGRTVGPISPIGWEAVEYYFWGAFGTTAAETSAYHGLNFFAAEFGDILVYPGGNGFITRRLAERVAKQNAAMLRTRSCVLRVERAADGTLRVLSHEAGRIHEFRSTAVIFASPLFLAAKIIPSLPEPQLAALSTLNYRSYAVANVLLRRRIDRIFTHRAFREGYELTPVHGVDIHAEDTQALSTRKVFSDAVVGDFPVWRHQDRAVLTVYRPYPYDSGSAELLEAKYSEVEAEVRRSVLDMFGPHGLLAADIEDIRISRWGHPMIVARPGQLADGTLARAAQSQPGLYFAHTDVQGAPAFENAMAAATDAADAVARLKRD